MQFSRTLAIAAAALALLVPDHADAGRQLGAPYVTKKPKPRRRGSAPAPALGATFARQRAIASDTPYNGNAGRNRPRSGVGRRDRFGNADGGDQDLARDGAFRGQQIAVLQLYNNAGNPFLEPVFDFEAPRRALEEKGFAVHRWTAVPRADEMARVLRRSSQLWVISGANGLGLPDLGVRGFDLGGAFPGATGTLGDEHVGLIADFFHSGRGLYLWGDNAPYFREANQLGGRLLGTTMSGDVIGDQVLGVQRAPGQPGIEQDHLLTTGLEHLYEGITIATIAPSETLRPLIVGSAGNVVAAYHDRDGRRAILDGGFTRLYVKWDTAGTARYLKNAAAWLANTERFGRQAATGR